MVAPMRDPLDGKGNARQPASPVDLNAHPPVDERCMEIRQMLRDYVDADLSDADRERVDAHAHTCRACALSLSRAESELMLITSAMAEVDFPKDGPGREFTAKVMAKARAIAAARPSVGFTKRVMSRVREEALVEEMTTTRWFSPHVLGLAAAALVLLIVGLRPWWVTTPATVEVVAADRTRVIRADGATVAADGVSLGLADAVATDEGGFATVRWSVPGKPTSLYLGELTQVRLVQAEHPEFELLAGEVEVTGKSALTLTLGDNSAVAFSAGHYRVVSRRVRHQDARPGFETRVRVVDGSARIVRGESFTEIEPGFLARYDTFGAVSVFPVPSRDLIVNSRVAGELQAAVPAPQPVPQQRFFGEVLDPRTNTPVARATVTVTTFRGKQTVRTDADGRFRLAGIDDLDGQFAVLRAVPPPGASDLSELPPTALVLSDEEPERVILGRGYALKGRVQTPDNRVIDGAWVQAARVDEVFGIAVPRGPRVVTDVSGAFAIDGLAQQHPVHQSTLLVAGAPGHRPVVLLARTVQRGEDSALNLTLPVPRRELVSGFGPNSKVQLLLPVAGLPPWTGVYVHEVSSDASGHIELEMDEPIYLLSADGPPVRVEGAEGPLAPQPALPPQIAILRTGAIASERLHWFGGSSAFAQVARVPDRGGLVSVSELSSGQACPGSLVFLRPELGEPVFLGVYDSQAPLLCDAATTGELLAITPEGWVGRVVLREPLGAGHIQVRVEHNTTLQWPGDPGKLLWMVRDGVPVLRDGGDGEAVLLPGDWEFSDGDTRRWLQLRAGDARTLRR